MNCNLQWIFHPPSSAPHSTCRQDKYAQCSAAALRRNMDEASALHTKKPFVLQNKACRTAVGLKETDLPRASQRSRLCCVHFFKRSVLPVPAKPQNPPGCFQGCVIQQKHIDLLSTGQLESPMLGWKMLGFLHVRSFLGYSSNTLLNV